MSRPCDDLDLFFDGELPPEQRAAFEVHLGDCPRCQQALHGLMQLTIASEPTTAAAPPLTTTAPPLTTAAPPLTTAAPPLAPVLPLVRRRSPWLLAPVLAAAAAAVLYFRGPGPDPGDMSDPPDAIATLTLGDTRGLEARLSYGPADRHRDYTVLRSGGPGTGEAIPLAELSRLEAAGDLRGLAAAHALRGELAPAIALLERLPPSPDRDSDRAALALAQSDPEAALAHADAALAQRNDHPQARWNRALALRELGLPRAAAATFSSIADQGAPGWASEAKSHAESLLREPAAREQMFAAAQAAGEALVRDGTPLPDAVVDATPSLARLYFYDALRAAPSADRARALAPLAATLDRLAGGHVLSDRVEQTADSDFTTRAPLAQAYAALALGRDPGLDLVARARKAGLPDLELGARVHTDAVAGDLDRFTHLAEQTGDPWLRMLAAQERAAAETDAGAYADAEATLAAGLALCGPGLDYRCARLELAHAALLALMHRLSEAATPLAAGLRRATQDQHWGVETSALQLRGELARLRGAFGLARAITDETLLRLPADPRTRCASERHARVVQASLAIVALDVAAARDALADAPDCDQPPGLTRLFIEADLLRQGGTADDTADLLAGLSALRAAGLHPGEAALADHIEGRVRILSDRGAGQALLRKAIAAARELPRSDPHALKALSFSHASLALDAAAHGEHAAALQILADEVGAPATASCALGLVVDHERSYAVALDPTGAAQAELTQRTTLATDVPIPEALVAALRPCPEVAVFARPPLAGRPGLLPPDIAWSYRVGHPHLRTGPRGQVRGDGRLVVADAQAPASLGLPRLAPWRDDADGPRPRLLAGPDATPTRVLQALPLAAEVEFHVHGLVDLAVSDASFLALSPGPDGHHALTAGQIRGVPLPARPLVILGACHAGQVAPYLHEAWSLPVAFLEAGARAVIASPAPIDDRQAGPFFAAVRARISAGASPAVAVRDERVRPGSDAWAASVLVFE